MTTEHEAACGQLGQAERAALDALLDYIYEYGTAAEGVVERAALLCQSARDAERESMTREEAQTCQRWAGMDGAFAYHLIGRHANGWGDIARMMDAWLHANIKTPNA